VRDRILGARQERAGTEFLYACLSLSGVYPNWNSMKALINFLYHRHVMARGGVVVKALRYKPARRGFDPRWCHWNF